MAVVQRGQLGPAGPCLAGMMPRRLAAPMVGRKPTAAQWAAGARQLLPVSVPRATSPRFAATAAALPPLDPTKFGSRNLATGWGKDQSSLDRM